jgi:ABC-type antimicrobial peptide transport system permease subunit
MFAGAKMAMFGCGLGVVGSVAISRIIKSLLFDVSATDPVIYAASVATMLLIALAASALPALHAASADPIRALRSA